MKPTPNLPSRKPDAWLKRSPCQAAVATLLVVTAWPALAETPHRVVAGDTLWSIAEQHTGDATQWRALQQANRVADPHKLRIGQVLNVPMGAAGLPVAHATVVFVQGEALATGPDGQQVGPLRSGASVPEGTLIEVRDKSFVRLRLADGSAFGLSPGSTARLERLRRDDGTQQSHTVIRMLSGRVESEVVPRQHPQTRFDVHTPMAVASVRGTRFGVSVSPDEATSEVSAGKVAVRSLLTAGKPPPWLPATARGWVLQADCNGPRCCQRSICRPCPAPGMMGSLSPLPCPHSPRPRPTGFGCCRPTRQVPCCAKPG